MPVDTLTMHAKAQSNGQKPRADRDRIKDARAAKIAVTGGTDPTAGYRATNRRRWDSIHDDLPFFNLRHAVLMLTDPVVRFGLNVRDAALSLAEVDVTSTDARVVQFVGKTWKRIWGQHGNALMRTKRYGYAGFQVNLALDDAELVDFQGLKPFAPADVRVLVGDSGPRGLIVKNAGARYGQMNEREIFSPNALWTTFDSEFGEPYGQAILRRSYGHWWEKWMDHGVVKVTQLRMIKDAYMGLVGWYPPNKVHRDVDGNEIPWVDLIREALENMMAGSAVALPMFRDEVTGEKLIEVEAPKDTGNPVGIWEWTDRTDHSIWRGLDVFQEVIEASETGSGYSGRSVPLMMFLQSVSVEFAELLAAADRDIIRWLVWMNFGPDAEYDITPHSLIESFAEDTAGTQLAGNTMGQGALPSDQDELKAISPTDDREPLAEEERHRTGTRTNLQRQQRTPRQQQVLDEEESRRRAQRQGS